MSLQDWLNAGWLTAHRTSPQEIGDLLTLVARDLADARAPGLSADWRLNIAYNAALQAATAALAAAGFRAARDAHHHRTIQSLRYTLGADAAVVAELDLFRKKRNASGYERAGAASDHEADEMFALAQRLRHDVIAWLRSSHPELVKGEVAQ